MSDQSPLTRRAFLAGAAAAGLSLSAAAASLGAERNQYAPFRMGIQSYSLRGYKAEEALQKTKELGLTWWEAFPNHLPITDEPKKIDEYKELLRTYGVTLWSYGVVDFITEAQGRKTFDFAKAMGIRTLSAYPRPNQLDMLDKLVDEYKINIAIHNHGPGDNLYDKIDKVEAALAGHHHRIGACVDTGHDLRSHQDPVEAVRRFGDRVYGVHLKDVKEENGIAMFTEIGKGQLDTVGLLRVLKGNNYPRRGIVALEYEEHEHDPMSYIQECLAATRDAVAKVNS